MDMRFARVRRHIQREMAFINVANFSEFVMRSQHRGRINNREQPVIWVSDALWTTDATSKSCGHANSVSVAERGRSQINWPSAEKYSHGKDKTARQHLGQAPASTMVTASLSAPHPCEVFSDAAANVVGCAEGSTMARRNHLPVFDATVRRRGRGWGWFVSTTEGKVVMCGSEGSRPAAKYQANRAIFLLLSTAPYRPILNMLETDRDASRGLFGPHCLKSFE